MHACTCSSILKLFFMKFLHASSYFCCSPWIHLDFELNLTFDHDLEHWSPLELMHVMFLLGSWKFLWIVFNWLTFGLDFTKLIYKICCSMSFQVFSKKWAQKVEFWTVECLVWAWEANMEILDFGFHARATIFCSELCLSEGRLAWA